MESAGGSSGAITAVSAAMPSPSSVADTTKVFCSSLFKATKYEFDPSIAEEERRFYLKAYPTVDTVRDRKTHCTVCKTHIGTAPVQENGIKMHPILRVTHCNKCHDFYNSGEFSKGEDGSELYCRWCGQGGEVYCCSSCPYVFCKSCIVKNLSRGVVADIEQNENWNCFSCAPKILWPLRAQHWALMNYIEQQKMEIYAMNLSEAEQKQYLSRDVSKCCRLAKAKCGNMSDSMESLDSVNSKRSHASAGSAKKPMKHAASPQQQGNSAKRPKTNDDIVCTPDLLSMLEPDCQITVSPKPNRPMQSPSTSTPKIMSVQQQGNYSGQMSSTPKNSVPPPLVLRNTAIKLRPAAPQPVVRRTIIGPRTPAPGGNGAPVYHTINGYRIDLNSAAQQETFRLPNGKLIQVKRQGPPAQQNAAQVSPSPNNNWQQMNSPQPQRMIPQTIASRAVQITPHPYNITIQQQQQQQQGGQPQVVRQYHNMIGSTSISTVSHNGTAIQVLNGQMNAQPQHQQQQQQQHHPQQQQPQQVGGPIRPVMIRHVFPDTPIGQARTGLQEQVFNAMEICTHLTNKVQTLTNSNAYKQARNYLEVKELYIHLSYLLTYAIGRFKGLQDKCLGDMRTLGFGNDADSLENGQLAADKQASDDEDNEIEIVEPKTDLINLDSDDDEPPHTSPIKTVKQVTPVKINKNFNPNTSNSSDVKVRAGIPAASISPANKMATIRPILAPPAVVAQPPPSPAAAAADENMDLMSMAQSFLASMLEVDIHEGPFYPGGSDAALKKQPRKKLTNKPNPTLLKQKAIMERERLEELKRNDQKLKMKCAVALKKAEEEFPYAKEMLEAKLKEDERKEKERKEQEAQNKLLVETGKKIFEVEVVIEDSPTKEKNNDKELSGEESGDEAEKKTEKSKDKVIKTMEISDEEEKENSIDKGETEKENSIAKEKEKTAAEEDKPEDVTDDEQEKSKVDTKENSVEITDNGKDSSVEVIDDEKDKSVEALNNDTDKSVEVLDKDGDETDMEEDIDEITDKEKSLEAKDEEKEKSKETKDEEKEKSLETKDEDKEKSIETKDEVKDESMEHEDKDNEKSMEVENIDKNEVVEDIDEKENNETEKINDKSDEILEPLTEESEQTTLDKVENEDKIDNNKTNGINEKDKVEDKDEEMETDENNKTENEITDETMEIDDKESPQESNIPEAIEEKNTVAELVVDKEIEQVLQKLPAEDDDNVLLENKDEKIISDNDEEESILPDDSAVHTTADSVITSSSEVVTEKVLPSVEPANETPPIEATTTATTTTTTTPSNDNVVF